MATEKLIDVWGKRNPQFEKRYEDLIKLFTDYGKGSSIYQESRGKIFGAGYEIYIIAFFIGLYAQRRKPLNTDSNKRKGFGQPIMYWGNKETKGFRKQYSEIQKYIFVALVARSDVNYLDLDKGIINNRKAVDILITTMEEYANWGFDYIDDKMVDSPEYFYRNTAFLNEFLLFISDEASIDNKGIDVESLD